MEGEESCTLQASLLKSHLRWADIDTALTRQASILHAKRQADSDRAIATDFDHESSTTMQNCDLFNKK